MNAPAAPKVALVTGASAGIGKAIVRRLLRDGWTVWGAARRTGEMSDIAADGARTVGMDVTDEASMQAAVAQIVARDGRIDALVNNAGYGSYGAIEDVPIAEARRQFEVNIFGLVRLVQLVLPGMRERRSGTIVNISSMGGRMWTPVGGWYHATKHALEVLSDALRVEVRPFGVNVVVVQPGRIRSEWSGIAAKSLREASHNSPYRAQSEPMAALLEEYADAAPPEVVADAVGTALAAVNPRRRYAVPMDSRAMIALHWLLPDALWEKLITGAVKKASAQTKG